MQIGTEVKAINMKCNRTSQFQIPAVVYLTILITSI